MVGMEGWKRVSLEQAEPTVLTAGCLGNSRHTYPQTLPSLSPVKRQIQIQLPSLSTRASHPGSSSGSQAGVSHGAGGSPLTPGLLRFGKCFSSKTREDKDVSATSSSCSLGGSPCLLHVPPSPSQGGRRGRAASLLLRLLISFSHYYSKELRSVTGR